jgi:hypothetical protein
MNFKGILAVVLSLFSCTHDIPKAQIADDDYFCDIDFVITDITTINSGCLRFTVDNILEGKRVLFSLIINANENKKSAENPNIQFISGKIETAGDGFDAFVNTLAALYSIEQPTTIKKDDIELVLAVLETNANGTKFRTKAFVNSDTDNESMYAEFYINIDIEKKLLQIREKDPGYRSPLIKALSGEK